MARIVVGNTINPLRCWDTLTTMDGVGYGMVLLMGFLDPKANVVRYHARLF